MTNYSKRVDSNAQETFWKHVVLAIALAIVAAVLVEIVKATSTHEPITIEWKYQRGSTNDPRNSQSPQVNEIKK